MSFSALARSLPITQALAQGQDVMALLSTSGLSKAAQRGVLLGCAQAAVVAGLAKSHVSTLTSLFSAMESAGPPALPAMPGAAVGEQAAPQSAGVGVGVGPVTPSALPAEVLALKEKERARKEQAKHKMVGFGVDGVRGGWRGGAGGVVG